MDGKLRCGGLDRMWANAVPEAAAPEEPVEFTSLCCQYVVCAQRRSE